MKLNVIPKTVLPLMLLCSFCFNSIGQWQQLPGPYGHITTVLGKHNGYLYSSNNFSQIYDGIYRTNNNGNTWTNVSAGIAKPYASSFASLGGNLFTCSDTNVYMSTNNGNTWTIVNGNLPAYSFVRRLVVHNAILFAAVYNIAGYEEVFYTSNNGTTWNSTGFTTSTINDLYSDGNNLWLCGSNASVYVSNNNGISWTLKAGNIAFSYNVTCIAMKGDTGYCGTGNYLYMTTDGGNLWWPQSGNLPSQPNVWDIYLDGNNVYVGMLNGGVYKETIAGTTWNSFGTGLPNYEGAFSIEVMGTDIFIASWDGVWHNQTSGGTWTLKVNGINQAMIRSVYSEGNFMLASNGSYLGLMYSNDYGQTWQSTNIGYNSYISWIKKIDGIYWGGSSLGGLITSSNGTTWSTVAAVPYGTWNMITCGNLLVLATDNGLYKSDDNGFTWINSSSGLPANPQAWRIEARGLNIYAMINGKGIYESSDCGNSWHSYNDGLTGLTSINEFFKAGDFLMLRGFAGQYRRLETDSLWKPILGSYLTGYDYLFSGNTIFAATSQGVSISDDAGESWHFWNEGFDNTIVSEWRTLNFDGNTIFGGTTGFGIWKRNFLPVIKTQPVPPGPYCVGQSLTVSFSSAISFNPGNRFIVQLSDSSGYFINNPLRLDSITAIAPSPITVTIPVSVKESNFYRIRVIATDPYVVVEDNGSDIIINKPPLVTLQPANQSTCDGSNSGFYVGATGTNLIYQWQMNTGSGWTNLSNNAIFQNVNDPLMLINGATALMNGYQFRCVVSNSCAPPSVSNAAQLNVSTPAPVVIQQPVNDTICETDIAVFNCLATGAGVSYRWQYADDSGFFTDVPSFAPYSGVNTSALTITNPSASFSGLQYRCKIGNSCAFTNTVILTINGTPYSNAVPSSVNACNGGVATFGVNVPGEGITFQWEENTGTGYLPISNGGNYSGADSAVLTISNISPANQGYTYRCVINGVCMPYNSTSAEITLNVITTQATITLQPVNSSVCEDNGAFFAVAAAGTAFYQWQINTGGGWFPLADILPYSGVNSDTLLIDATPNMSGHQFRCVINGCTYSNAAALTVNPEPVVTLSQFPSTFCYYDPQIALSGGLPSGGSYFGSGIYNNEFSPGVAGIGTHSIGYIYTNAFGCSDAAVQILEVSSCTGVTVAETSSKNNDYLIYPNPVTDRINLIKRSAGTEIVNISICNIVGQVIFIKKYRIDDQNKITIPVSDLSQGFYSLSIYSENHKREVKNFIKVN